MNKLFVWGVPLAGVAALAGWRVIADRKSANDDKPGAKAPVVMVAPVEVRPMVQSIQSVGNVTSPYKVEISPKIAGRIQYLVAREGDSVTPGELLVKIDPSDLEDAVLQQEAAVGEARSRLAQAELTQGATDVGITSQIGQQRAALASAQADLDQTQKNAEASVVAAGAQVKAADDTVASGQASVEKEQATLLNTKSHLDRTNNLYGKGFLAAQDLDDARTAVTIQEGVVKVTEAQLSAARSQLDVQKQNLEIAKRKGTSDIEASRARLAQARAAFDVANANRAQSPAYRQNIAALKAQLDAMVAQVGQAKARMRDTEIKSTIAGTVTARKADPGGLASPGSPVLELQFLDWIYISASIPAAESSHISKGDRAEITIDALPGKTFSGPIVNLNSAADPQSRQFGINIRLENPKHDIRPGMFARVKIVTKRTEDAVVVPNEALNTDSDGKTTVTVVDGKNVAHIRSVALGPRDEKGALVTEGVQRGDRVVVLTFNQLKDGQKVTLSTLDAKQKDVPR